MKRFDRRSLYSLAIVLLLSISIPACMPSGSTAAPALTDVEEPSLADIISEQLPESTGVSMVQYATVIVTATPPEPTPSETPEPTATATPTELPPTVEIEETATPEFTVTATEVITEPATPGPPRLRSVQGTLNIRLGPGTGYDIAGYFGANEEAEVLARNRSGSWFNILRANGQRGWVSAALVEFVAGDEIAVAVAATVPALPTSTFTPTAVPTASPVSTARPNPPSRPSPTRPPDTPVPVVTATLVPPPPTEPPPTATQNPYP